MRLLSWLRTTPARPPRPGPRLEALGDRTVPAALRVNHDFNVHAAADASNQHGTLDWAVANAKSGDTILLTADAARTGITLARGELILTQQNLTITTEAGLPVLEANTHRSAGCQGGIQPLAAAHRRQLKDSLTGRCN